MKSRTRRHSKNKPMLTSVAESIGSALGTIASKANAAQRILTHSDVAHSVERGAEKLVREGKVAVRKTKRAAAGLKRSKAARATRRRLRSVAASAKRVARRATAKKRTTRKSSGKR